MRWLSFGPSKADQKKLVRDFSLCNPATSLCYTNFDLALFPCWVASLTPSGLDATSFEDLYRQQIEAYARPSYHQASKSSSRSYFFFLLTLCNTAQPCGLLLLSYIFVGWCLRSLARPFEASFGTIHRQCRCFSGGASRCLLGFSSGSLETGKMKRPISCCSWWFWP